MVTGTGFGVRDFGWIKRNIGDAKVQYTDVTSTFACINIAGPNSRDVLRKIAEPNTDLSNEGFPFFQCREIRLGAVPVRALRLTFVGIILFFYNFD